MAEEERKRILYHISDLKDWKIGDIIESGAFENRFWKRCKTFDKQVSVNGNIMSVFDMIDRFSTFDVTEDNINFLYDNLKTISKETAFYIREQVFEDVREREYPNLPSRQKCLWVTGKEKIPYWKTIHSSGTQYLLTLELEGDLFCGDDYWLTANTFSSEVYEERAKHYWTGEKSSSPNEEYLFCGKATVVAIDRI